MNTQENTPMIIPVAYATRLAKAHAEGHEQRCRRWRHWATLRRWFSLMVLLAVAALLSASITHTLAPRDYTIGDLSVGEAESVIWQILLKR